MPPPSEPILNTCPECSQLIDVSLVRPYEKIACPHCGQAVRVRNAFDKFIITGEIGEGGMSRVFRAQDTTLGRDVALKVLHDHFGDHPELTVQFEKEARVTASLNHPNIVKVYSVGRDQGYFYIAMELLRSESLEHQLEKGSIDEITALRMIHEVALGLAAAHANGLLHRDIKPGNILLDASGTAKLADFGLALIMGAEEELADLWATPFYVPPEKLRGKPDDLRGDIYSLGATLFHMLSGSPPHQVDTTSTAELLRIKSQPANLRAAAPKVRQTTVQLVHRMMAFEPVERFTSYAELIAAIGHARSRVDPHFTLPGPAAQLPGWAKFAAAVVAVGLLVGLIAFLSSGPGEKVALNGSAGLNGSSGEIVLTAEDNARMRALDVARKAYGAGNVVEALRLFQSVASDPQLRGDLRSWASFHLGMEALLKGDSGEADRLFGEASAQAGERFPDLATWFAAVATDAPPEDDSLAALVLGYRRWLAGDFAGAATFLGRYREASFPGDESWRGIYHDASAPLLADALLLADPPPDTAGEDLAALRKTLDAWTALLAKLRLEPARQFAQERVKATGTRIVEAERMAELAARRTDEALLSQTGTAAAERAAQRDFAAATALWNEIEPDTDWGRKQVVSAREACERAGRFFGEFIEGVGRHGYNGEILRTSGAPFKARIVSATPDKLLVDLGFGATPIDLAAISAAGILGIARSTILQGTSVAPETREGAAFFAWFSGEESAARELSRELQDVPGFARRWEALTVPPEFR